MNKSLRFVNSTAERRKQLYNVWEIINVLTSYSVQDSFCWEVQKYLGHNRPMDMINRITYEIGIDLK